MVEPDRPDSDRWSSRPSPSGWGLLAAVGIAGLLTGWIFGSTAGSEPTSTSTTGQLIAEATSTSSTFASSTSSVSSTTVPETTTTTELPPLEGRVELLPGATDLLGAIALTVPLPLGDQNFWVIQSGGRMVQRTDVQIRPGGYRFPVMVVGDHVLFTTPNEGTYRMGLDLSGPVERIAEPGFLVPAADTNRVWLVGGDVPEWFAEVNGDTGELGERTDVPQGFGWPLAGFDDGILFHPEDTTTYGAVAYVPRQGEPQALNVDLGPQSGIHSVVGNEAAVVSPGANLTIVNLHTGEQTATLSFDPDGGNVVGACLSEDSKYLAAISSTGFVEVFDTNTGESQGRVSTTEPPGSVGWAAPSQLIFISATGPTGASLHNFDIEAGMTTAIARLAARSSWQMAISGTPC